MQPEGGWLISRAPDLITVGGIPVKERGMFYLKPTE